MHTASTEKKTGKRIFNGLRLLGIILFVIILFRVDLKAIGNALLEADFFFVLLGILFQIMVLISKGIRWHLMNDGRKLWKYWAQSLGRFYESYAIGVVTPGRMGELIKAGHETGKNNIFGAGIRVLAERGLDIGVFVALAGLSVLSGYYIELKSVFGWTIIGSGAFIIVLSVLIFTSARFIRWVNTLFQRLPGKWKEIIVEHKRFSPKITFAILLMSLISNISYFISCYYLGQAAGINAGFIWIAGAVAVSGLLNMLPVTIMGLGTREVVFLYVFQSFDQNLTLAFSFLVVFIAQIGGGLIALSAGQFLIFRIRHFNYE